MALSLTGLYGDYYDVTEGLGYVAISVDGWRCCVCGEPDIHLSVHIPKRRRFAPICAPCLEAVGSARMRVPGQRATRVAFPKN